MPQNSPTIIPEKLKPRFALELKNNRVVLFNAPCGSGKTVVAKELLKQYKFLYLSVENENFSLDNVPENCPLLLLDDLHLLESRSDRETLCQLIRTQKQTKFVLLTRGAIPGWLMPFQFAGVLQNFDMADLLLDKTCIKAFAKAYGVSLTDAEIGAVLADTKGYPVAIAILMRLLFENSEYNTAILNEGRKNLFLYFDEMIYRRFSPPLQKLLLMVAPFESFNIDLAQMLSGDSQSGELVAQIQQNTSMLQPGAPETLTLHPIFRAFLLWKLSQELNAQQQKNLFTRAGIYYELHAEMKPALDCYAKVDDQRKISELLVKNAQLHVGVGQYLEMEQYYFAMPDAEILRSPTLMAGMSMICALFMDFDQSEKWYSALQNFAGRMKKTDSAYKDARARLAYLDIALPQRGSAGLIDTLTNIFNALGAMQDRQMKLPSVSVTGGLPRVLNGGKDFSEWTKRDTVLYTTMGKPIEGVLGRDGVGLADCTLCESFFEKDADYQPKLLKLLSRLSEIQRSGVPDVEFAVVGLLCRVQIAQGQPQEAFDTAQNLRSRFVELGETRFLPNLDALVCRIAILQGDSVSTARWLRENAPKDDLHIWVLHRYQYQTKALALMANGEYPHALRILAPFVPYSQKCSRTIDQIHLHIMNAICHFRMNNFQWENELVLALDIGCEYKFIRTISEYGNAVLPLLTACSWKKDATYFEHLISATRKQAVNYPLFLKPQTKLKEPLTAAEQQVLKLLCHNMSNGEICDILRIKLTTVKTHVRRILQKLGVSRRSEAKEAAQQLELI